MSEDQPSYTCPRCGLTSYNPNDLANKYCVRCHVFEEDEVIIPTYVELQVAWQKLAGELFKKDAEIKPLKKRVVQLEKWMQMTDEQVVMDLKAEIERLKAQLEAQEIRVAALRENRAEDNQLITELVNALEPRLRFYEHADLIPRAREAAKDE